LTVPIWFMQYLITILYYC